MHTSIWNGTSWSSSITILIIICFPFCPGLLELIFKIKYVLIYYKKKKFDMLILKNSLLKENNSKQLIVWIKHKFLI